MWWRRWCDLFPDRSIVDSDELVFAAAAVAASCVPANLAASTAGSVVTLQWSAVSGATEYMVLVGSTPSSSDQLSTNTTNNSYTWTARPGQQYARVQAKCGGQFGGSSNEVTFTVSGSSAD